MEAHRLYLDSNVFSILLRSDRYRETRERLKQRVLARECEVFGSMELLEEFAGLIHKEDESEFSDHVNLFWTLVDRRVLEERRDLLVREIRKGHRLSIREACVDAATVAQLRSLPLADKETWGEVFQKVRSRKGHHVRDFTKAHDEFVERAAQLWSGPQIREFGGQLSVNEKPIRVWYGDYLKRLHRDLGLPADTGGWPDVASVPCFRAFVAFDVALIKKRYATGRKHDPGDGYDLTHYVHAAIPGCLVTADGSFRDTCGQIEWQPIPVLDMDQFSDLVLGM